MKLTKPMLKCRKTRMTSGPGEAWFFIGPKGLEVCVANFKGNGASNFFTITRKQMELALRVMDEARAVR